MKLNPGLLDIKLSSTSFFLTHGRILTNKTFAKKIKCSDWTITSTSMKQILKRLKGPGGSMSKVVGLPNNSYKPITNTAWVRTWLCKLQKGCTRLATASDKVYQLLAHGRWFSFNATFNNISAISWRPVLVVEEAGVPGENHRPWASNW
jgi:hypothetical protein